MNTQDKTPHVHAKLMKQYAEDAANCYEPWKHWQMKTVVCIRWVDCTDNPCWDTMMVYRRKPDTIETHIVNGFTVQSPLVVVPKYNQKCYLAAPTVTNLFDSFYFNVCDIDKLWFERGLVFSCESHAVANAKAMIKINPKWSQE